MVICQYFRQGRCRFGQNCRNEHSFHENGDRNARPDTGNQTDSLAWQVAEQVVTAEKGNQWPLTCFAPFKDSPCIPGWDDVSPEELRWNLYEARGNGNVNQCISQINQLYVHAEKMRNAFKHPTREIANMTNDLLKGKEVAVNTFGSAVTQPNKSDYRFEVPQGYSGSTQGSIFGGSSPNQNPFMSGQPAAQNVFSNQSSTGQNIFTNQPSQSIFSNPPTQTSNPNQGIFGNAAPSSPTMFANTQSNINQSIFSNQQPNQNAFPAQGSIFSNSPPFTSNTSAFPQTNQSVNYTNIFGGTPSSAFQSTGTSQGTAQPQTNIFGGTQPTAGSFSNESIQIDASVYSKIDDLTEEEQNSFAAPTFAFGKIPLRPPPQQLC